MQLREHMFTRGSVQRSVAHTTEPRFLVLLSDLCIAYHCRAPVIGSCSSVGRMPWSAGLLWSDAAAAPPASWQARDSPSDLMILPNAYMWHVQMGSFSVKGGRGKMDDLCLLSFYILLDTFIANVPPRCRCW